MQGWDLVPTQSILVLHLYLQCVFNNARKEGCEQPSLHCTLCTSYYVNVVCSQSIKCKSRYTKPGQCRYRYLIQPSLTFFFSMVAKYLQNKVQTSKHETLPTKYCRFETLDVLFLMLEEETLSTSRAIQEIKHCLVLMC